MYITTPPSTAELALSTGQTTTGTLVTSLMNALAEEGAKKPLRPPGGWSSLIGIVTAICGNILISFALNIQRYAHIRLGRDRAAAREAARRAERNATRHGHYRSYGTEHENGVSSTGLKVDGCAESHTTGRNIDDSEDLEAEPLLARSRSSLSSDESRQHGKDEDEGGQKSYLRSPIWWLGIGLMVVGEAGNFLAYGFAPASIVSPMGVVALISNCLIAPLLLGERFRWRDGAGVIIAVAGCVTVVLSASDSNPKLTPDTIWYLITRWEFETYFGVTACLIVALMMASNRYGHKSILIDVGLVGVFGGYTALSTKGIASLLSNTIWRVVTFPITYLLFVVLVFTAVMQIKYINRALQRFSSTMVIPTQFVLFTLSVIIGSAVLYRDFEREEAGDAAKFFGGCALTFLGVWCITSGRTEQEESHDGDSEDEQDGILLTDEDSMHHEIRERDFDNRRKVSVTSTSSRPAPPTLKRYRTTDSMPPSLLVTSDRDQTENHSPFTSNQTHMPGMDPANVAAIHADSLSHVHQTEEEFNPPPFHATTSTPTVPTQNDFGTALLRQQTPLERNASIPGSRSPVFGGRRPQTPGSAALFDFSGGDNHGLMPRPSVGSLFPGPLTSPLSGSLSAIVADSIRRGVDTPSSTLKRRRSSKAGNTAPQRRRTGTLNDNGNDGPVLGNVTSRPATAANEGDNNRGIPSADRKKRSLGDLFSTDGNGDQREGG